MKDALIVSALSVVPQNAASRAMGAFARARLPAPLLRPLLRWYVWKYGVDLSECAEPLGSFDSLVAFFTRALRPGARPVDGDEVAVVSPADGLVYAAGRVEGGRLPQAPGMDYAVRDLLAAPSPHEGGSFVVVYLSPRDYHRVHAPVAGDVVRADYLPGRLWPVFPAAAARVRDLFAVNERLTTWIRGSAGEVAVVMVGAFGVGRMRVVYDAGATNTRSPARSWAPDAFPLAKGAELGRFEMGSTVILLFEPGRVEVEVEAGRAVRVGQRIGRVLPAALAPRP
jgi:phosphatidylserine decarboxylase